MKKMWLVMACALTVMGAAGCSGKTEAPTEAATKQEAAAQTEAATEKESVTEAAKAAGNLKITFVSPLLGNPVWLSAKAGAEAAAAEIGAEVTWVGPAGIDMDEQVRLIELATVEQVDGIICCPLSPSIFEDVYRKAMDKGITVVNTGVDSPEDTRTAYIGTDYVNFGEQAAKNLAEKLGGSGNVAALVTSMDSENQVSELKAGEEYLKKNYPDVKIIVTEITNSDTAQAADKTGALLDTYPELNAIWCIESTAPLGVAQTVQERNLQDKITILGIDDTEDVLDLVDKEMIWGTMTQDFYKMGYEAVKMIDTVKGGGTVPSIQDSGTTLVTKENLQEYKEKY